MPRSATTGLYSTLTNSNYPALPGVTIGSSAHNDVIEDQQDAINVTADQLQGIAWTDAASASTVDLGAIAASNVRITGTTTITSFGTVRSGITKTVRFAAALTLTNNSTSLILPGGANITTAANDIMEFVSLGSGNWICTKLPDATGGTTNFAIGASNLSIPLCAMPAAISAPWMFEVPPSFLDRAAALGEMGIGIGADVEGGNFWQDLQVFEGGIQVFSALTFQSNDAGALGPVMQLYHNSASPAANDIIGILLFQGEDSAGNSTSYADLRGVIDDPTNGSEDAHLELKVTLAGASVAPVLVGDGLYGAGSAVGYPGVGGANMTHYWSNGMLKLDSFGIVHHRAYTVATLPAASGFGACEVYVADEVGGGTLAFSDSVNWRRVQDRAIVS